VYRVRGGGGRLTGAEPYEAGAATPEGLIISAILARRLSPAPRMGDPGRGDGGAE
jgi:hypothetical protein